MDKLEEKIHCTRCKSEKMELINSFSYLTFAKVYYKCNECGYKTEIIYLRETLKKANEKLYRQLWSN